MEKRHAGRSRRGFLKGSAAAGMVAGLPNVGFLRDAWAAGGAGPAEKLHGMLRAQMIRLAEPVPVPLLGESRAESIASSEPGHARVATPDLHGVFAREMTLRERPSVAVIRIFAYTRYRLYVNGVYQGRGPCRFQNQRPEYDTREITGALRPGRNVIAVLVHRDAPTGRIMRHEPGFAAAIELTDGAKTKTVATDGSWVARPELSFGPRAEAWASIQEHIDARKGIDLGDPGMDVADWPRAVPVGGPEFFPLWPRETPLQQETRRSWRENAQVLPVELVGGREVVFALPEIVQGYSVLEIEAEAGSELEVQYLLPEDADSGASSYIARAGAQRYMGGDTFAFDRLGVTLRSGRARLLGAEVVEVRYPFERVGAFTSSDPFLNQLWSICARSVEVLSEDAYVDCADRERVEWTDNSPPAFDCTRVMMRGPDEEGRAYWGDNRLLKSLLRRIALTQQPDGQIKAHSCSERFDIHAVMEDRSCDWVVLLREYVESGGGTALVVEMWPVLQRLLRWFLDRRTARGLVLAREWEAWDNPLRYQVCEGAGLNALFYRALRDAAWLGEAAGKTEDSRAYTAEADRLRVDFNRLLWNEDAGSYDGGLFGPGSKRAEQLNQKMFDGPIVDGRYRPTAQAALFALYGGIVPEERLDAVRRWVLAHLDEVKGPMSHYYLFHALYAMDDPAQDGAVLRRMREGWKLQVESPWQTTWEELVNGGASKVHMYGMVPGYFLTAYVLGARRVGRTGERVVAIEPHCGDLASCKGIAVTEFGPVEVAWTRSEAGGISLECTLPERTSGRLRLYRVPGQESLRVDGRGVAGRTEGPWIEARLGAGRHRIVYPGVA